MYKKLAILFILALVILSAAQPASAATKLADLRLQATKNFVTGSIDAAIKALDRMETGIDDSTLKDSQKAELKAQIQSNVTWLEQKRSEIKADTDIPAVLAHAREASDRWNVVNPGLKKEIGLMASDNTAETIATARNASSVISFKVDAMKAQGKNTAAIEKALASYNGHLDSASQHVANARSEFNAIAPKWDGHYAAGMRQLTQAGKELTSAYGNLKTIYGLFYGSSVKVD